MRRLEKLVIKKDSINIKDEWGVMRVGDNLFFVGRKAKKLLEELGFI